MKKKWTNNIGIKILSVAIAFLLWVVIINIEDPTTSRTFRVQVDIQNDDIVELSGQVYKITEGESVDVTVKGNKSFVDSLTEDDLTATADFKYLSNYGSVPITAKCTKYTTTKYTLELGSVDHVLVELEDISENTFIVRFNVVNEPAEGYYVDTNLITSNPTKVTVTGGESVIKSIASVAVDIDARNQTSNFSQKLQPKIYDSSGNIIDSVYVSCNVSEVTVNVTVLETKTIPVNVTVVGEPAYGYMAEPAIYDPTEVTIAGTKESLSMISSIELKIDVTGKSSAVEEVIDLTESYLPEGIYLDDKKTTVNIEVPVEKLKSKEITFNASDIAVKLPSGSASYSFDNLEQEYKVNVFAVEGELEKVSIDSLKPTIDLTDKDYGTYNVEIQFSDTYLVEAVGSIKVKVTLVASNDQDNPEASPEVTAEPPITPTQEPATPGEDQDEPEDTDTPATEEPTKAPAQGSDEDDDTGQE